MNPELRGPGDRYRIAIEALCLQTGQTCVKHVATTGIPLGDADASSYLVVIADDCTLVLAPGENGLWIRSVSLLNASEATIFAVITADGGAPKWLPHESICLLFRGNRQDARLLPDRFIALEGMAAERSWPSEESTPLDHLAVAIGRSVARANAKLSRLPGPAGVALVSQVTVRIPVTRTDLSGGRVLVGLGQGESNQGEQFVEFTLSAVPSAGLEAEEAAEED